MRFALLLLLVSLGSLPVRGAEARIQESGDLLTEIERIRDAMPGRDSEGFNVPTATELEDWRTLAVALLALDLSAADSLVSANLPNYELVEFLDTGFQNRTYYLLRERIPLSRGWGTYLVNPAFERNLMVQVPHPRNDLDTWAEGADLFRQTGSRFFLMAGTHRCASGETSPCSGTSSVCEDGTYRISDVAHFVDAPFQAVHEVLDAGVPNLYVMSLHGNGQSACENIFLSNGHPSGSSLLYDLKHALIAAGGLTVGVAGDGSSCSLIGSTNVQGRFTNGSPDPCGTAATVNRGYFIHVEQHRLVRQDPDEYGKLIQAVNQVLGPVTGISTRLIPHPTLALASVWPNPGRVATVQLSLAVEQEVTVELFDVNGRRRTILYRGILSPGSHLLRLEAQDLVPGKYWVSARGNEGRETRSWMKLR